MKVNNLIIEFDTEPKDAILHYIVTAGDIESIKDGIVKLKTMHPVVSPVLLRKESGKITGFRILSEGQYSDTQTMLVKQNFYSDSKLYLDGVEFSLQDVNIQSDFWLDEEMYKKVIEDVDKYLVNYRSWPF